MALNSSFPLSFHFENDEKGVIDNPIVELDDQNLWKRFSENGTEMVITKVGRRMFPIVRIKLSGLDKKSKYITMLEIVPTDTFRYKYVNGKWRVSDKGDVEPIRAPLLHPDSPQTGEMWMNKGVNFKMLKLSNDPYNASGHCVLNSMHRYHPRFHIVRCDISDKPILSTFKSFIFKDTEFMAVTAYQNDEVTKMKIENNPFAKGFRNISEKREPRKRKTVDSQKATDSAGTPPASEDEEPVTKRVKISENPIAPSLPIIPKFSLEFFTQWQYALLSSFGNLPLPNLHKVKSEKPVKKSGFDVIDLLGNS